MTTDKTQELFSRSLAVVSRVKFVSTLPVENSWIGSTDHDLTDMFAIKNNTTKW